MSFAAWATLAVVAAMFVLMVRGASPVVAMVGALVALLALGIIDEKSAFSGFSNAAPMTVAALYVVARAVEKSGILRPMMRGAIAAGESRARGLLRLLAPSAAASAFLNNTPIVAVLLPGIIRNAEAQRVPPSRYLMPLSFAVVLGGVATTLGTSTNLVISGLLQASGAQPFGLFEISPLGVPLALLGVVAVSLLAPRMLPDRESPRSRLAAAEREFVVRMLVDPNGPLVGKTVEQASLRHLEQVFLAQIERDGEPLGPADPDTELEAGDHLLFVGEARNVADLESHPGLISAERSHLRGLDGVANGLVEVVIGPASPLLGKTPKEVGFRARYGAAIVGIHREGAPVAAKLGAVKLRLGDTLLLLAEEGFAANWSDRPDFVVVAGDDDATAAITFRAAIPALIGFGVVVLAGSGLLPILHASLIGALAVVGTRSLSVHEARASVELDVLVVIAASFGIGAAIEVSGLAATIGHAVVELASGLGWRAALASIVIATFLLTEFISNNAAAALMFPIAIATAGEVGIDPRRFAIAVAIAASCSFLTPIGYQTNMMVYGPGGYRFSDYARLGFPLTIVAFAWIVTAA